MICLISILFILFSNNFYVVADELLTLEPAVIGQGEIKCKNGHLIIGVRCKGQYCFEKELECLQYTETLDLLARPEISKSFIKENGNGDNRNNKFLSSIIDDGQKMRVRYIKTPILKNIDKCSWVSQNDGNNNFARCPEGNLASGIRCDGLSCDTLEIYCCGFEELELNDIEE